MTRIFPRIPIVNLGEQICSDCMLLYQVAVGFKFDTGLHYICIRCMRIKELQEEIDRLHMEIKRKQND